MNAPRGARNWRGYVGLSLAWLAILGGVLWLTRRPSATPIEILPPPTSQPTAPPIASPTPGPIRIDVAGAVRVPGVYSLPPGSIVADAIAAAGGPAADADLDRINKAIALQDGVQVYVPHITESAPPPAVNPAAQATTTTTASAETGPLVNINTATAAELDTLPGVGPAMAQRIIEGRPYGSIEDIMRVKGIGQATFDKLKEHITVQ